MGLKEIAIGGIYFSPLLLYALLGFVGALIVRTVLHRIVGQHTPWFEAWFDAALFVIITAIVAFVFSPTAGIV
ncbi:MULTISPECIES: DUF1656 domain-containing protein [Chromohalobacter]|jgi:hypothetical protein|uniref:DUF1656 domain-containing protein n=1 Tax=Chromohalobacter israelensis (strain ATCC BAA-138 / DSM 3043 / CIP 106854 / NCIMB 13768 / 1H11) TaxID=290398 RepID=Q1QU31_CHRI1|nr:MULTISPECIES: DUF1656 domain-containing protein [Chromohalobacter]ABE60027.1 protein of unknown function DUF1656 [Chromohalobacter salexigens DSM 3043]MBZ5875848.1 DUF1656 domain-containing protein [Chromohalobacter salexigens]MDF9434097.1 DUF1656 domain-containing protein [Chromohalobacter israelensis]MDO0945828.1 DUF1656 domain-containing protein [Chromohalobacter salexigens]NQY44985.1 DUF1656 domain-containing protein [Chromohalobacter sp.]